MVKENEFKDMFPAYMKKCVADKRTRFQFRIIFVVFAAENIEDHLFNFEGKYRRHENYTLEDRKR